MSSDVVVAASFATPLEAEMAKNHLENEGIAVHIADEETVGWFWYLGNAVGGVKLLVAAEQLDKARELLQTVLDCAGQSGMAANPSGVDDIVCVECGRRVNPELGYCPICDAADDTRSDIDGTLLGRQDTAQDESLEVLPGDAIAHRALRAAVFGILACPPFLHIYSLGILIRLAAHSGEVSPRAIRAGLLALLIDVLALVTVSALFSGCGRL